MDLLENSADNKIQHTLQCVGKKVVADLSMELRLSASAASAWESIFSILSNGSNNTSLRVVIIASICCICVSACPLFLWLMQYQSIQIY